MKAIAIIFIVFLFEFTPSFAQEWAPVGAVWHYGYSTFNPNVQAYKTITSGNSDAIVNGEQCRMMHEYAFYEGTSFSNLFLMYSKNDSVFYYDVVSEDFCLLYDFSAQTGDDIYLDCYDLTVHVDSTSTRIINQTERRVQYVSSESFGANFGGTIIEGIGDTVFMFPQGDNFQNGPLRCYEDNEGLISFSDLTCDTIINTNAFIPLYESGWVLFPNPVSSVLYFRKSTCTPEYISLKIYSEEGKLMYNQNYIEEYFEISLEEFPSGMYTVLITSPKNEFFVEKFLIE